VNRKHISWTLSGAYQDFAQELCWNGLRFSPGRQPVSVASSLKIRKIVGLRLRNKA
jgi:hypothetical protein